MIAVIAPNDGAFRTYLNYVRGRPADYKRVRTIDDCRGFYFDRIVVLPGADRAINDFDQLCREARLRVR